MPLFFQVGGSQQLHMFEISALKNWKLQRSLEDTVKIKIINSKFPSVQKPKPETPEVNPKKISLNYELNFKLNNANVQSNSRTNREFKTNSAFKRHKLFRII